MKMFNKSNSPIVIKNTDFRRCVVFISFPIKNYREEDITILKKIAFDRSMKYNTDRKIFEINVNNYCLSYGGKLPYFGNSPFLEFSLSFPSEECLGIDVLDDNLEFIKEIIYNPYIEDNSFPKNVVEDCIRIYKDNNRRNFDDPMWYFPHRNTLLIDEDNYMVSPVVDNLSLLDNVDGSTLYNLYKSIISGPPLVFMIGNVDEEKAKKSIEKIILDNKISNVEFEMKYNNFAKNIPNECDVVEENTNFNTSFVSYSYKVKDMADDKDKALLRIVDKLLESDYSRLLFDKLRNENNLVYRCGSRIDVTFGIIIIASYTSKDNIDKVYKCYDEVMNKISNIDFISERLPLILEEEKMNELISTEKVYSILMKEVDKYLELVKMSDYDAMKNITPEEVSEFVKNRLVLVLKYAGVGDCNE